MRIIALFCFAGILLFPGLTKAQTRAEAQFFSRLERALKDKEPEWDVNKIVFQPGIPIGQLENGKPLLSPRGNWRSYELKSKQWAGSISIFYGDSQRDAANQFIWSQRSMWGNGASLPEPIGAQSVQMIRKEWAGVMSTKANVCVSVHIKPVDLPNEDKPSEIEAKTAKALEIAYRFTKHIVDQAPAN
jgi:hypothetical protein